MAIKIFKKYNYSLECEGVTVAGFSEISGFDATIDVIEYREGTDPINSPRKLNGLTKYGNVTIKWGMYEDMSLYEWVAGISDGSKQEDAKKDITITLRDDSGANAVAIWTLMNAWPSKYTGPDFNATSSEISFESIEFVFEEMKRVAV